MEDKLDVILVKGIPPEYHRFQEWKLYTSEHTPLDFSQVETLILQTFSMEQEIEYDFLIITKAIEQKSITTQQLVKYARCITGEFDHLLYNAFMFQGLSQYNLTPSIISVDKYDASLDLQLLNFPMTRAQDIIHQFKPRNVPYVVPSPVYFLDQKKLANELIDAYEEFINITS